MKVEIKTLLTAAAAFLWLLPLAASSKPLLNVQVSILPQKYFVERIGKDRVRVAVLVKPGKSPEIYSPSPDQMKELASSDVYFRIGVPFENGILLKIESLAGLKVVDTRQGILLRQMEDSQPDREDPGHDAVHNEVHHDHVGRDPHIWMSPVLVKEQAHTIFQTLVDMDPDGKDAYQANYDLFVKDLDDLDTRLKTSLKGLKGENLFVFHPSFGYFTDAYGLTQVAVETMGKAPKGKALSSIIKLAKKQKTRVIFVQPQFDRNSAQKIAAAINGSVVSIDPLAYDYLANMNHMAQTIAGMLGK